MTGSARDDDMLRDLNPWQRAAAGTHLLVSSLIGLAIGCALGLTDSWQVGGLAGWIAAASVFLAWTWTSLWSLDARHTGALARREDPARGVRDLVLVAVATGSLIIVAVVVIPGGGDWPLLALGIGGIVVSWLVVHTVSTLGYARLYYAAPAGGIDFNQDAQPTYHDFAYVAFTIGMTFQVSDTELQTSEIRSTALRHALLSFLFGAIILAVTINVIAGAAG